MYNIGYNSCVLSNFALLLADPGVWFAYKNTQRQLSM